MQNEKNGTDDVCKSAGPRWDAVIDGVPRRWCALSTGDRRPPPGRAARVPGFGPEDTIDGALFDAVGGPAGDASYGEHGREEIGRQAQPLEEQGGVELDVGLETPAGLVLLEEFDGGFFDAQARA